MFNKFNTIISEMPDAEQKKILAPLEKINDLAKFGESRADSSIKIQDLKKQLFYIKTDEGTHLLEESKS